MDTRTPTTGLLNERLMHWTGSIRASGATIPIVGGM
jgi:hypothetical protein